MALQLIICVEADKQSKSDYLYIKSLIDREYIIDQKVKLQPVYMGGKGSYNKNKTLKEITAYKNKYASAIKGGKSAVIFCFDCDKWDTISEDKAFIDRARDYCDRNGYDYVWFCKDIESVFLGHPVADERKKQEAENFVAKDLIEGVDVKLLYSDEYKDKHSNIMKVLDKHLKRKK